MSHLDDEALSAAARSAGAGGAVRGSSRDGAPALPSQAALHLRRCRRCAQRLAAMTRVTAAVRQVDQERVGVVVVPPFDVAVASRLAALGAEHRSASAKPAVAPAPVPAPARDQREAAPVPGVAPAAGLGASWRLAVEVLARQRRLLPAVALGVMTVVGLVLAVVLAVSVPTAQVGARLFAASVGLVVLVGAGAVCSPRWDPRRELLVAMPVSPVAVFGCRLTLVLGAEVLAAVAASVIASALGMPASLGAVILGWLGPALLAAATLVVVSVWRSAWQGGLAGALVWFLGVAAGAAQVQGRAVGLGEFLAPISVTTAWTLTLAAALIAAALAKVAFAAPARTPR